MDPRNLTGTVAPGSTSGRGSPHAKHVEVLVVGGGTVGLSTALFLAHHGVAVLVVERQDGPSSHPRATGVGPRTVEMFRAVGLENAVNAVAVHAAGNGLGKITVETLASADLSSFAPAKPSQGHTPSDRGSRCWPVHAARTGSRRPATPPSDSDSSWALTASAWTATSQLRTGHGPRWLASPPREPSWCDRTDSLPGARRACLATPSMNSNTP